jgi:hypothetical protein
VLQPASRHTGGLGERSPQLAPITGERRDGDQAINSLSLAIASGERNPDRYRADPDLDALRSRPDFQLLLMDLDMPANPLAK